MEYDIFVSKELHNIAHTVILYYNVYGIGSRFSNHFQI